MVELQVTRISDPGAKVIGDLRWMMPGSGEDTRTDIGPDDSAAVALDSIDRKVEAIVAQLGRRYD